MHVKRNTAVGALAFVFHTRVARCPEALVSPYAYRVAST